MKLSSKFWGFIIGYSITVGIAIALALFLTGCNEGVQKSASQDNRFTITLYGDGLNNYLTLWHDNSNGNEYITSSRSGIIQVQNK